VENSNMSLSFNALDRMVAKSLPGEFLRDFYPRAMRRLAEHGILTGKSVRTTRFGFEMEVDRLDAVKWYVHYFGILEPHISRAWINILSEGDYVIDIGANVGYHSLLAGQCVGKTGMVVSFEPSDYVFAQLDANVKRNRMSQITLNRFAVSDKKGEVDFYFAGENVQGNSSIIPSQTSTKHEKVQCVSFDEIRSMVSLEKVKVIKIDVEGAEEYVMRGLHRNVELLHEDCVIFVEISPENANQGLRIVNPFLEKGFSVKLIKNEYSPSFYWSEEPVQFRDVKFIDGRIHDVVLCRNEDLFSKMIQSNKMKKD
jgi:FkbM family methyltransferase